MFGNVIDKLVLGEGWKKEKEYAAKVFVLFIHVSAVLLQWHTIQNMKHGIDYYNYWDCKCINQSLDCL